MRIAHIPRVLTIGFLGAVVACGGMKTQENEPIELGPHDGHDLPGVDLDRVVVGDLAPDFSLEAYRGDTITLSDFRGSKNVVLVFYRGHW